MKRAIESGGARAIAVAALSVLALIAATPAAHAQVQRTGREPWYQESTPEARRQAQVLFEQGVDKHLQLLRGAAMELYAQALVLWDNPDVRWNLALVLDDLGKYLSAHEQFEYTLRWDAALGADRLQQIRARMDVLERQRLARIEVDGTEPEADIQLDGQPWFRGVGRRTTLVTPGTHYVGATKPEYTPTSVSLTAAAGEQYRVTLRMRLDHPIDLRRWSAWKPWSVVAAGVAGLAAGAVLERQAFVYRDIAANKLRQVCDQDIACAPTPAPENDRARTDSRRAIAAFAVGGTAVAIGAVLSWLNQPRGEIPKVPPSSFELVPTGSPGGAGISAQTRF
jgi:tetratricopeptide (TPR) repeat protein